MPKVESINVDAIFSKQTGRPLDKKPYINPGIENKKKKDTPHATPDSK